MALYDVIGRDYNAHRAADPRIVDSLVRLLDLTPGAMLADIGAGTGNYANALAERGFAVIAVEPSSEMRGQAPAHDRIDWRAGVAEALPLADGAVDGLIVTLALHHFSSLPAAAREFRRVCRAGPAVIFTIDPRRGEAGWFGDYFAALSEKDFGLFPAIDEVAATIARETGWCCDVETFPLPHDLADHNMNAGWNRPEFYLDPTMRANTSGFARARPEEVTEGLDRLRDDLETGAWDRRNGHLRTRDAFDAGYLFLTCRS